MVFNLDLWAINLRKIGGKASLDFFKIKKLVLQLSLLRRQVAKRPPWCSEKKTHHFKRSVFKFKIWIIFKDVVFHNYAMDLGQIFIKFYDWLLF